MGEAAADGDGADGGGAERREFGLTLGIDQVAAAVALLERLQPALGGAPAACEVDPPEVRLLRLFCLAVALQGFSAGVLLHGYGVGTAALKTLADESLPAGREAAKDCLGFDEAGAAAAETRH